MVGLVVAALFAAWSWFRPYDWNVDPGARCSVVGTQVKQDGKFHWVHIHLKVKDGETHDLMKPVRLETVAARLLEPADTTLGGGKERGTTDLWFKFWLEAEDLEGPLTLKINDGSLVIRTKSGAPRLGSSGFEYFVTNRW